MVSFFLIANSLSFVALTLFEIVLFFFNCTIIHQHVAFIV